MNSANRLLFKVRVLTTLMIFGLVLSGLTALPLVQELAVLADLTGPGCATGCADSTSALGLWFFKVHHALLVTQQEYPFLFYGTDWLAFGHFVIAIAFLGALHDPIRNRWLFDFGLIACALVIPWALLFGAVRAIPFWWRLIDCSFGVLGAVPLWFCRRWVRSLDEPQTRRPGAL